MWLVLAISLVLLWDNWNVYNGGSSMFFRSSDSTTKKKASVKKASAKSDLPESAAAAADSPKKSAKPIKNELIRISTDVALIDIDTEGGVIKRLELLKHLDKVDPTKNTVLFDTVAPRTYLAQTGLIGGTYPNHRTSYAAKPGPRTTETADQIQLVLEAEENGVVLTKTFTFKKNDYVIGVRHDVKNLTKEPISPSLYLQILRDGDKPEGESKLMSTFTGPAVYTDADKFQKLDFEKIESGKESHATKSTDGWVAMVQHYFVSAFIPQENAEREIFSRKIDTNLYAVGNILPPGFPGRWRLEQAKTAAGVE